MYDDLDPVLKDIGLQVPDDTTVSICLPVTPAIWTDYPIKALDDYCKTVGKDSRGVSFVRAKMPSLLDNVPAGAGNCISTSPPLAFCLSCSCDS